MKIYTVTTTVEWIGDFAGDGAECLETSARSFLSAEERDAGLRDEISGVVSTYVDDFPEHDLDEIVEGILAEKCYCGNVAHRRDVYECEYNCCKFVAKWSTFVQEL